MLAYLNTPTKFDDPKGPRYTSLFFSFPHNASFSASTCLQQSKDEFFQKIPSDETLEQGSGTWRALAIMWNLALYNELQAVIKTIILGKEQAQPLVIWGWLLWFQVLLLERWFQVSYFPSRSEWKTIPMISSSKWMWWIFFSYLFDPVNKLHELSGIYIEFRNYMPTFVDNIPFIMETSDMYVLYIVQCTTYVQYT